MMEQSDDRSMSELMVELRETVERWQQSKYFRDLQAWKEHWYRVNGESGHDNAKEGEL